MPQSKKNKNQKKSIIVIIALLSMPKLPPFDAASCSTATNAERLKSILRDRQLREKWKENVASSSTQAIPSSEDEGDLEREYFEMEESADWAEELKRVLPSESEAVPWAAEWHGANESVYKSNRTVQEEEGSWIEEFESKEEASWTNEFTKSGVDEAADLENGESWITEFKQQQQQQNEKVEPADEGHLAESASELLSRLDLNDDRLRNSQFVAYLRKLADGHNPVVPEESAQRAQEAFENWREEFRRAIDPLVTEEDATWESWKKDWQQYQSNGNGYEGFAFREFQRYQFASNNPYLRSNPNSQATATLRDRILALEAQIQRNPSATLWANLGALQSENELDIQAIAAFQEALKLDANHLAAWLGLALACLNERCIPDAYEAIENWIKRNAAYSRIPVHFVQAGNRNSELLRCFLSISSENDPDALIFTSVLQNLDRQPEQAIETLRRAVALRSSDPALLNRLGATLANIGRYAEALGLYDQALSMGFNNPRLHYNRAVSLMSIDRYSEAQRELVEAIQLQLPVSSTHGVRPDLRAGYQSIWNTLRLLCELTGNDDLAFEAEMQNLSAFLPNH